MADPEDDVFAATEDESSDHERLAAALEKAPPGATAEPAARTEPRPGDRLSVR